MPNGVLGIMLHNSGTYASPTLGEIDIVSDVKIARSKNTHPTTKRRGKGINTVRTTTGTVVVTFMLEVPDGVQTGNPNWDQYKLFSDAWDADEVMPLMFLDGPLATNGSKGMSGYWAITKFDEDNSNDVSLFADVEIQVADVPFDVLTATPTAKSLRKVRIAGGNPTYANWGSKTYA